MQIKYAVTRTQARFISGENLISRPTLNEQGKNQVLLTRPSEENASIDDSTPKDATASGFTKVSSVDGEKVRYNEYGIQMISEHLRRQLFRNSQAPDKTLVEKCSNELKRFHLGEKRESFPDISFNLPKLLGDSIEEHFYKIGQLQSEPYKLLVNSLLGELPKVPDRWELEAGWTRYRNGVTERVPYPGDDALLFDIEVCKAEGEMPTIATAVSKDAWYGWVSGYLADGVKLFTLNNYTTASLIPLESNVDSGRLGIGKRLLHRPRIVMGHNVSFDRARVREQYWLLKSNLRFLDTLSLHVCISGITSYQKSLLKAGVEGESEWSKVSSLNSLTKVHKLYCGSEISKEERELFLSGSIVDIRNNFQTVMGYCAKDVVATHAVLCKLWPLFLDRFPHPVTLAGMLELQSAYVPVNHKWNKYLSDSKATYDDLALEAKYLLAQTAKNTCKLLHGNKHTTDLWMWDQQWTTKHIKMRKTSVPGSKNSSFIVTPVSDDGSSVELKKLHSKFDNLIKTGSNMPVRKPLLPGYPEWYRKLCSKPDEAGWVPGPTLLTNSMQVAPKLLNLTWKGLPLHYIRGSGWGYISPCTSQTKFQDPNFPFNEFKNFVKEAKSNGRFDDNACAEGSEDSNDEIDPEYCSFIKLPHKDGANFNVGNPLGQDYINKFSDDGFSGSLSNARRIISISKMLSYWRNNRERIESQLVCWLTRGESFQLTGENDAVIGAILPLIIVCGTLTRRAVEPTWMTVSNSVVDRVGSEFRGVLEAPPGYCFVGADVDSQELWIASLMGDAHLAGTHGCTPFGWMTLNGHRSDGSDLHSVTAKAVGISRNHAKILNYARIYGSGQKFAQRTLLNFNPGMTPNEAANKAAKMYQLTKGKKKFVLKEGVLPQVKQRLYVKFQAAELCRFYNKDIGELFENAEWVGGTESDMFNSLERIANGAAPETPFLGCKLSRALVPEVDSDDKHGNTRINWVVQSSAVDFLHLMVVCMKWLLGEDARFSLSFHDEVHYLVPDGDKYSAALALHVTNLLTRTFCVSRLNMTDLPLSVAFFTSVEIDSVLRKDPLDDNLTPSNPHGLHKGYGIPSGESLDIYASVKKVMQLKSK